jgi:hypothetical protein
MKWIEEIFLEVKVLGQKIDTIDLQNYELLVPLSHFRASQ